jgi:hypothetical protein
MIGGSVVLTVALEEKRKGSGTFFFTVDFGDSKIKPAG